MCVSDYELCMNWRLFFISGFLFLYLMYNISVLSITKEKSARSLECIHWKIYVQSGTQRQNYVVSMSVQHSVAPTSKRRHFRVMCRLESDCAIWNVFDRISYDNILWVSSNNKDWSSDPSLRCLDRPSIFALQAARRVMSVHVEIILLNAKDKH